VPFTMIVARSQVRCRCRKSNSWAPHSRQKFFAALGAAVPSDAAAFGFLKVGLHPQRAVDPGHELSPAGPDPFHDDQVEIRRNLDRPRPAAFVPAGGR
jgi:hypothetical protein